MYWSYSYKQTSLLSPIQHVLILFLQTNLSVIANPTCIDLILTNKPLCYRQSNMYWSYSYKQTSLLSPTNMYWSYSYKQTSLLSPIQHVLILFLQTNLSVIANPTCIDLILTNKPLCYRQSNMYWSYSYKQTSLLSPTQHVLILFLQTNLSVIANPTCIDLILTNKPLCYRQPNMYWSYSYKQTSLLSPIQHVLILLLKTNLSVIANPTCIDLILTNKSLRYRQSNMYWSYSYKQTSLLSPIQHVLILFLQTNLSVIANPTCIDLILTNKPLCYRQSNMYWSYSYKQTSLLSPIQHVLILFLQTNLSVIANPTCIDLILTNKPLCYRQSNMYWSYSYKQTSLLSPIQHVLILFLQTNLSVIANPTCIDLILTNKPLCYRQSNMYWSYSYKQTSLLSPIQHVLILFLQTNLSVIANPTCIDLILSLLSPIQHVLILFLQTNLSVIANPTCIDLILTNKPLCYRQPNMYWSYSYKQTSLLSPTQHVLILFLQTNLSVIANPTCIDLILTNKPLCYRQPNMYWSYSYKQTSLLSPIQHVLILFLQTNLSVIANPTCIDLILTNKHLCYRQSNMYWSYSYKQTSLLSPIQHVLILFLQTNLSVIANPTCIDLILTNKPLCYRQPNMYWSYSYKQTSLLSPIQHVLILFLQTNLSVIANPTCIDLILTNKPLCYRQSNMYWSYSYKQTSLLSPIQHVLILFLQTNLSVIANPTCIDLILTNKPLCYRQSNMYWSYSYKQTSLLSPIQHVLILFLQTNLSVIANPTCIDLIRTNKPLCYRQSNMYWSYSYKQTSLLSPIQHVLILFLQTNLSVIANPTCIDLILTNKPLCYRQSNMYWSYSYKQTSLLSPIQHVLILFLQTNLSVIANPTCIDLILTNKPLCFRQSNMYWSYSYKQTSLLSPIQHVLILFLQTNLSVIANPTCIDLILTNKPLCYRQPNMYWSYSYKQTSLLSPIQHVLILFLQTNLSVIANPTCIDLILTNKPLCYCQSNMYWSYSYKQTSLLSPIQHVLILFLQTNLSVIANPTCIDLILTNKPLCYRQPNMYWSYSYKQTSLLSPIQHVLILFLQTNLSVIANPTCIDLILTNKPLCYCQSNMYWSYSYKQTSLLSPTQHVLILFLQTNLSVIANPTGIDLILTNKPLCYRQSNMYWSYSYKQTSL